MPVMTDDPIASCKLAVLIDADNATPQITAGLFEEIAKIGEASVRRISGDFTGTRLRGWAEIAPLYACLPHQNFANTVGKNASDIALVIGAMNLLHSGQFDDFCLVSSDGDFTRLAARIREQGIDVFGFGENKAPASFRQACKRFIYTKNLTSSGTRIADKVALIVDDGRAIERGVARNAGDKTSALETIGRAGPGLTIRMPATSPVMDTAVERYAHLFLVAEQRAIDGRPASTAQERELGAAAAALDRVRVNGAEDLRIVLDRELASPGTVWTDLGRLTQAWLREGEMRTDRGAYAERFVVDWKAVSADSMAATTNRSEVIVERRQERLEGRMLGEPALERALDRVLPERQLRIDGPGPGGLGRDRDFGMEM